MSLAQRFSRAAFALLLCAASTTFLPTTSLAAEQCEQIETPFVQKLASAGCVSSDGFCLLGEIDSGVLAGKKSFAAEALTPAAGLDGIEPNTTYSFSGPGVISTDHGDLTLSTIGVFDAALGIVTETNRVQGGTGSFEGARGILFVHSTVDEDASQFESRLSGTLCLASDKAAGLATLLEDEAVLRANRLKRYAGRYEGTYSGDDSGTFSATINKRGRIRGTVFSNNDQTTYRGRGRVTETGRFEATAGGSVSEGSTFSGRIRLPSGRISGKWRNPLFGQSGRFRGRRL